MAYTIIRWYCIGMLLCAFPLQLQATATASHAFAEAWKKAQSLELHKHPTWLRLLYFNPDYSRAKNSEILSPRFFLSHSSKTHGASTQGITPEAELKATLHHFFYPDSTITPSAKCRFPARFYWLTQQLALKEQMSLKKDCKALANWAKFSSLDSVSLILVSGYFGNPASTFGHLLIKLNNSEYKSTSGNLLDESINYGAQVPDNETIPVYILKGLFGGYASRFSHKEFYSQDMMYSRQEFRDMWEYELNLNEEQQTMLVYHLWEVMGMESTYLFLTKNCGYRVAELLELVTDSPIKYERQPWYLPISVFQELTEIEQSKYIKKITFLPSNQRKLYHNFAQLSEEASDAANLIISNTSNVNTGLLKSFDEKQQTNILDVLHEYYQYQLTNTDQEKEPEKTNLLNKRKNQLLAARLQLPINHVTHQEQSVPSLASPATGAKPRLFSVGLGKNKDTGNYIRLGLTGIHYDLLTQSRGSLENAEIKVFELDMQYNEEDEFSINTFNLASIQKLNLNRTALNGENSFSWRFRTGFKKRDLQCIDCEGFYLTGGMGQTWKLSANFISYAMVDGEYHQEKKGVTVTPVLGLIVEHTDKMKTHIETGYSFSSDSNDKYLKGKIESRYSFTKNDSLRLSYEKNKGSEYTAAYYRHW